MNKIHTPISKLIFFLFEDRVCITRAWLRGEVFAFALGDVGFVPRFCQEDYRNPHKPVCLFHFSNVGKVIINDLWATVEKEI